MNIEKLARHLKEFTLDEIEMIVDCDCKTELEHMQNTNKIVFEQGVFKIVEVEPQINYGIFENNVINDNYITVLKSTNYFLKNHVSKFCKQSTYRNYECIFRFEINPFFRRKYLNNIEIKDVKEFYKSCVNRGLSPRRIKNILALLNQLLKYSEENLGIKRKCVFQVKRITEKNEFNLG